MHGHSESLMVRSSSWVASKSFRAENYCSVGEATIEDESKPLVAMLKIGYHLQALVDIALQYLDFVCRQNSQAAHWHL